MAIFNCDQCGNKTFEPAPLTLYVPDPELPEMPVSKEGEPHLIRIITCSPDCIIAYLTGNVKSYQKGLYLPKLKCRES